jgi:hypothetical protein
MCLCLKHPWRHNLQGFRGSASKVQAKCTILASCLWVIFELIAIDFEGVVPGRGLCLQGPRQGAAGQAHHPGFMAPGVCIPLLTCCCGCCMQGPRERAAGQAHYPRIQAAKPRAQSAAGTGNMTHLGLEGGVCGVEAGFVGVFWCGGHMRHAYNPSDALAQRMLCVAV